MMKRAFLVCGVESSGTRLVTRLLMDAGCHGDDGHVQRWDEEKPEGDPIVWRRSVPHGGVYPRLYVLSQYLLTLGYQTTFVVVTRDWFAQAISYSNRFGKYGADFEQSLQQMGQRYSRLFFEVSQVTNRFVMVSYESLVQRPRLVTDWLCRFLELPESPSDEFVATVSDENDKHFRGVKEVLQNRKSS